MDSLKIECFLAVAELNSYSKAADMLFKNQSVLSRQVMALEEELGVKLFYRKGRGVSLTPAGQVFRDGIRRIGGIYKSLGLHPSGRIAFELGIGHERRSAVQDRPSEMRCYVWKTLSSESANYPRTPPV